MNGVIGPANSATARVAERVWLFDLDNTLHNANARIFPQLSRSMVAYIREHLHLDEAAATALRQEYWRRYGATMLGLMHHHDIKPEHFLHHTHQFPDLPAMVLAERGLKTILKKLPGRKILFSNAPSHYTETVLNTLGIRPAFAAVYTVERLRFQPKPALNAFFQLLRQERLNPGRCVMVEDSLPNLKSARKLGMKTVWVSACTRRSPYVDVKISSILDLPRRLGQL